MKAREFRIIDIDHIITVEFASRKYMLELIEDYIENLENGFDMSDFCYDILYKDGTEDFINEEYDGHKIRKINIASIIEHNPEDDIVYGNFEMNEYGCTVASFETVISDHNIEEIK